MDSKWGKNFHNFARKLFCFLWVPSSSILLTTFFGDIAPRKCRTNTKISSRRKDITTCLQNYKTIH